MTRTVRDDGPDPIDIAVGLAIRDARKSKGIGQEELARAAGVAFQQLQKYESGMNRVSASRLVRIARRLGVSPGSLLPDQDAPTMPRSARLLAQVRGLDEVSELYQALTPPQRRAVIDLMRTISPAAGSGGAALS